MAIKLEHNSYQIGNWIINCNDLSLIQGEIKEYLPAKVFEVLKLLIINGEQTLTKVELVDVVWQGNMDVGLPGLTNAIWQLRKVLTAENEAQDTYIQTIPKIGYRLVAQVQPCISSVSAPHEQANDVTNRQSSRQTIGSADKAQKKIYLLILLTVLVIALYSLWLFADKFDKSPQKTLEIAKAGNLKTRQLTFIGGAEEAPDISNDGKYLAFEWQREQKPSQVFIQAIGNKNQPLRQISLTDQAEGAPKFSPDGKQLAYIRIVNGDCQLRLRDLHGNKDSLLASQCNRGSPYNSVYDWSPDGRYIIYSKQYDDAIALSLLELNSGTERQISFPKGALQDTQVVWSDDAETIFFVRSASLRADIYSLRLNSDVARLTELNLPIDSLVWHSRQHKLIFNLIKDGKYALRSVSLDKKIEEYQLSAKTSGLAYNRISGELVFSQYVAQEHMLVLDPVHYELTRRIASSKRDMYGIFLGTSDDIVFNSNRSGRWEIWLQQKSASRQITNNIGLVGLVAASPVDNRFAFPIKIDGQAHSVLHLYDTQSASLERLDLVDGDVQNPSWSPDGQSIYFSSDQQGKWHLYKYSLITGKTEQVSRHNIKYAIEYNHQLILTQPDKSGLWRYDLKSAELSLVSKHLARKDWGSFWPTEQGIYYVAHNQSYDQIRLIRPDNSEQVIKRLPLRTLKPNRSLTVGPNGQILVTFIGLNEADIYATKID